MKLLFSRYSVFSKYHYTVSDLLEIANKFYLKRCGNSPRAFSFISQSFDKVIHSIIFKLRQMVVTGSHLSPSVLPLRNMKKTDPNLHSQSRAKFYQTIFFSKPSNLAGKQ